MTNHRPLTLDSNAHLTLSGPWSRLAIAVLICLGIAEIPAGPFSRKGSSKGTESSAKSPETEPGVEKSPDEKNIRINYMNVGWDKVLKDLSETSGLPLVADKVPSSKYSRRDKTDYDLQTAMKILNQDLEKKGFRLIKKGNYLVVVDLPAVRTEYPRPTIGTDSQTRTSEHQSEPDRTQIRTAEGIRGGSRIRGVGHQLEAGPEEADPPRLNLSDEEAPTSNLVTHEVALKNSAAIPLARSLYQVFKSRAELLDEGPRGLQAFRVFEIDATGLRTSEVSFSLGIDDRNQILVVEGTPDVVAKVSDLIELLDRGIPGKRVQPTLTKQDPRNVAKNLQPRLEELAEASEEQRSLDAEPSESEQKPEVPLNQSTGREKAKEPESTGLDGLKGDVSLEAMSELGVLILKGSQRDVDSVMKIIREIEKLSLGATPDVDLVMLNHVNSESLSRLLNSVYEKLHQSRVRTGATPGNNTSRISSIPVVKPNAILLLAPADEMANVMKLIEELDQPVPPESEYQVFRLEHTTPSRVEAMIDKLYSAAAEGDQPTGLATRVRVYGDSRTNSVVVQARPRDLVEVESLIRKLDVPESGPVSQLKIIPLKHANADELANTLRQAIQSVVSPANSNNGGQTGSSQGNFQNQGGDGGSSELNEVKSTILQFLSVDQGAPLRSGILTDIRINSDPRTNSLVVSAPDQSLAMVEALVRNLDRPSSAVAEIKVFELARSDASAMAQLLSQIFNTSGTGTAGNNQTNQIGGRPFTIAGSEDAGSQIPLKVSVDVRTNSIIATGSAEALKVAEAILLRLDQSDIRQRETVVVRLKNSKADDVAAAVNEFLTSRRDVSQDDTNVVSPFEQIEKEVVVVPELGSNSLIISASPRFFDEIQKTVERLDEAPKQVVIQALLVEVGLDNVDEFGIELGLQDSILFRRSAITDAASQLITIDNTTTELSTQTTTQTIVSQSAAPGFDFNNKPLGNNTNPGLNTGSVGTQGLSNFQLGRVNSDLGYGGFVFSASSESVSVLLRALAANRRVDILSRPQIRALDNQAAQIFVGQDVPRVNGVIPATALGAAATPAIEQKETGINLNVVPRITPDRAVVMQITAEKSALSSQGVDLVTNPNGSVIRSPILDRTVAVTTVSIKDGQTVVLGGMITKNDENFERKVPYLGDLPVVGALFRHDFHRSRRSELLIFLTPRIISTDEDSELLKQIEVERISMIESEAEQIHGPIMAAPPPSIDGAPNQNFMPLPPSNYDEDPSIPMTAPGPEEIPRLPPENSEIAPPPALPPAEEAPVQQMGGLEYPETTQAPRKTSKTGIRRVGFSTRRQSTSK